MFRENTQQELNNIRHAILELKEMEEIYLLARFSQDAKYMLQSMLKKKSEIEIHIVSKETDILKKFKTKYLYHSNDGNSYPEEQSLYTQLRCSNGEFREKNYIEEYKIVAGLLSEKMQKGQIIIINEDTTPEDFLKQLCPDYAIKYSHYELNKDLSINNLQQKPKVKL
jgi:hypothetical protein